MDISIIIVIGIFFSLLILHLISHKFKILNKKMRVSKLFKSFDISIDEISKVQQTFQNRKIYITNFGMSKNIKRVEILLVNTTKGNFIIKASEKNYESVKVFLGAKIHKSFNSK